MKGFLGLVFLIVTANGFSFERLEEGLDNSLQIDQEYYDFEELAEDINQGLNEIVEDSDLDEIVKDAEHGFEIFDEAVEDDAEEIGIGKIIAHLSAKIVAGFVVAYHRIFEDIKSLGF